MAVEVTLKGYIEVLFTHESTGKPVCPIVALYDDSKGTQHILDLLSIVTKSRYAVKIIPTFLPADANFTLISSAELCNVQHLANVRFNFVSSILLYYFSLFNIPLNE